MRHVRPQYFNLVRRQDRSELSLNGERPSVCVFAASKIRDVKVDVAFGPIAALGDSAAGATPVAPYRSATLHQQQGLRRNQAESGAIWRHGVGRTLAVMSTSYVAEGGPFDGQLFALNLSEWEEITLRDDQGRAHVYVLRGGVYGRIDYVGYDPTA